MAETVKVGNTYRQTIDVPIVDEVDVLVAGGGTAGCVAAIAAARNGAKTMLVERLGFLGGMITAGNAGLTKYIVHEKNYKKYREVVADLSTNPEAVQVIGGIPMEITNRLIETGAGVATDGQAGSYVFTAQEEFKLMLLEMMENAGVKLLLHSLCADIIKVDDRLNGIIVEHKSGRQAILAKQFIDATGDGDLAAMAGVPFDLGVGPDDLAAKDGTPLETMQPMGVLFRMGNIDIRKTLDYLKTHKDKFGIQPFALMSLDDVLDSYQKGDMYTFRISVPSHSFQIYNSPLPGVFIFCCPKYVGNGIDVGDLTQAEIDILKEVRRRSLEMKENLPGFEDAYLLDCPEVGVRETRHFKGEYVLNIEDIMVGKTYDDSIGRGCHPIDIQPIPDFIKKQELPPRWYFNIPYRSLVPLNVDNILLAGRCIATTHEANGCTRPTVQCMVTGEAAGTAAALCVADGIPPRDLDFRKLKSRLEDSGVVL